MIELILWCCFLVPGLIYSFWRLSRRHQACRACRGVNLLPIDSPLGRAMADQMGIKILSAVPPAQAAPLESGRTLASPR
jgi:hypothetical protein